MKNTQTLPLFLAFIFFPQMYLLGQIRFEPGYIISHDGTKTSCLIKNIDWRNNPESITYKLEGTSSVLIGEVSEIKEFGINASDTRFLRAEVQIDRSRDVFKFASEQSEPEWSTETLFLKFLVSGEVNLFSYWDAELMRYFYQDNGGEITQLVNKAYTKKGSFNLYWNHKFRQTLWAKINCSEKASESYRDIAYDKRSLVKYFIQENKCRGGAYTQFNQDKEKESLHLKIAPGVKYADLSLQYIPWEANSIYFDQQLSLRVGLELEYILPYNKNKWALFVEPSFIQYRSEHLSDSGMYSVEYRSVEFPLGIRHYFFLNPQAKLYINLAFALNVSVQEPFVRFEGDESEELELFPARNIDMGLGFMFLDTFSVEARYHTHRDMRFGNFWDSRYSGISFILGYRLL